MQEHSSTTAPLASIPLANGTCVLSGYGVKVSVKANHLLCSDGVCDQRREERFHRATSGLKQLVVIGNDGYISLAALQWLSDVKASALVIGDDGEVILAHAPAGCDYPQVRRAQALAAFTDTGAGIMRELIAAKVRGQAGVLAGILGNDGGLCRAAEAIAFAQDVNEIRLLEAAAANAYWQAWQGVPMTFARKDAPKVPEHWRTFGQRASHVANGPRNATTAGNALLNYCYAILQGETRIALLAQGLDPGLGLMHTDQASCSGLVYDVMEPARPAVDAWLLAFIRRQTFTRQDLWEDERGIVRLSLPIRRALTLAAPEFAKAVAPWVEYAAKQFADAGLAFTTGKAAKVPTRLTQANRSNGRAAYRGQQGGTAPASAPAILARCCECGQDVEPGRQYCDKCLPAYRDEAAAAFASSGPAALAQARENGQDPAHGGEAGRKRAETQARRNAERVAWEAEHGNGEAERARFAAEVLPKLAGVPVSQIAAQAGLSLRYASLVRRGEYVPHPMHHEALRRLVA